MPFGGIIPTSIEDLHAPPFGFSNWSVQAAIYYILTNDATVSGYVSSRVYPLYVPQNADMPAITYQCISAITTHTIGNTDDLINSLYQLNCWAETYGEARLLSEAVRDALNNYTGTFEDVSIRAVQIEDEDDMPEAIAGEEVLDRYGKRLDFRIWYD